MGDKKRGFGPGIGIGVPQAEGTARISGNDFTPGAKISLRLSGPTKAALQGLAKATADLEVDSDGRFAAELQVGPDGKYKVTAIGPRGGTILEVPFTVGLVTEG